MENGRKLPDYSILKNLCKELGVTINELLSGEKFQKEKYQEKLEENIIKLAIDSKKGLRKKVIIYYINKSLKKLKKLDDKDLLREIEKSFKMCSNVGLCMNHKHFQLSYIF